MVGRLMLLSEPKQSTHPSESDLNCSGTVPKGCLRALPAAADGLADVLAESIRPVEK